MKEKEKLIQILDAIIRKDQKRTREEEKKLIEYFKSNKNKII